MVNYSSMCDDDRSLNNSDFFETPKTRKIQSPVLCPYRGCKSKMDPLRLYKHYQDEHLGGATSDTNSSFVEYPRNETSSSTRIPCPYRDCPKTFKPSYLRTHIKRVHQCPKKKCEDCGKEVRESYMNQHAKNCSERREETGIKITLKKNAGKTSWICDLKSENERSQGKAKTSFKDKLTKDRFRTLSILYSMPARKFLRTPPRTPKMKIVRGSIEQHVSGIKTVNYCPDS